VKCLTAILMFVSATAFAETPGQLAQIQGLSVEANGLSTEAPGLSGTIAATQQTAMNIQKEGKVYKDDQTQKLAWIEQAKVNVMTTVYHPAVDPLASEQQNYNAECLNHTFNRETEMAAYNRCDSWKADLDGRIARINTWWQNYQATWNAQNVDPINAVIAKQNARIAQLQVDWDVNGKKYNEAMARMKVVRERVAQITGMVSGFCHSENLSGEAMKWCTNVDWDGASRSLPPLTISGTGGATTK
jgi:hypothetical protein